MAKIAAKTGLAVKEKAGALAEMEPWEVELAAKAQAAQASEVVGVPRITHRGSVLKIDGKKVEGNKLRLAILTYGRANTYFEKDYDPDSSQGETPDCYSFGAAEAGAEAAMKPHPASPKPQHEQCTGCRWNEFGSGKGNSKKCANTRKLLVIVPTEDVEGLEKAQVRQISVPPGSLKGWGNYLNGLNEITPLGHVGVVTEIGTEALDTGAYKLTFKAVDKLDREFVKVLAAKAPALARHLSEPYPAMSKKVANGEAAAEKPRRKIKGQ